MIEDSPQRNRASDAATSDGTVEPASRLERSPIYSPHDRRDLLDALAGCSTPWHDLDSEGLCAQ